MARKLQDSTMRALAARFHPDLNDAPVTSWNVRALGWEAGLRWQRAWEKSCGKYHGFIELGRRFAVQVQKTLKRKPVPSEGSIFYAYDTGALETFEYCSERGIRCVLNQMDPNRVEVELVQDEEKRWPGWQIHETSVPEEYFQRRELEWAMADRIVVNSAFARDALIEQGVAPSKLVVIPLSYEPDRQSTTPKVQRLPSATRPLRVLWLGQVILRKGIQYLIEAARSLKAEVIHFDVVGPIGISPEAVRSAPANVTFHGRATRDQAVNWYRESDVFVLPTLSDGFALTQLEAMSYGLPVIATPCCGDVVSDGVDGFIIPPRDPFTLAKTLEHYLLEPGLLEHQRSAALLKSRQFSLRNLAGNLIKLESDLLAPRIPAF